jgi:thioredoxin-related protein
VDGQRTKRVKVFYISKKDYSIVRYSSSTFWTVDDLHQSDSVIYTYRYYACPFKEVKKYVDNFEPLTGQIPKLQEESKDSLTHFPRFLLPDTSGRLKEISASYVLVDFWYKACAPCLANMKNLDKLHYKNLEIVTINIRDNIQDPDVQKVISKHQFTFLFNGNNLAKQLNVTAYPTMFLYDKNRNILYKHIGFGNMAELEEVIKKYLPEDRK